MSSSDDDEDLKRAIALSLADAESIITAVNEGESAQHAINVDSDDEIASSEILKATRTPKPGSAETSTSCASLSFGILGLNRKEMEQERLARKRKASISPPPARKVWKQTEATQAQKILPDQHSVPVPSSRSSNNPQASVNAQKSIDSEYFNGIVKKTWAYGHPRKDDDIKIEEILQKNELNLAVLSSFQWDIGWLLAKLNTQSSAPISPITLVMQTKDQATQQQYRRETASMSNLRLCFPSMEGQVNCMHSKLMLLSHPTYLRVAVPTANLVPYDWGESGDMENMVFIIDLPRLSQGQRTTVEDLTFFGRELIYFLEAMGLERSIIDSIYNFDFSATKNIAFIHTIGGAHTGDSWRRTGYCGLGRAVEELGLATDANLKVDFVTSSVGSLNMDFLTMMYLAMQGDEGMTEFESRNPPTGKSQNGKAASQEIWTAIERAKKALEKDFHIFFPTDDTVKNSTAGYAGTICFQSKWYSSATFPRHVMRDCKSTRPGLLMHNKIIYVQPSTERDGNADQPRPKPWAYIGSANCSESAWGKLFKDRSSKKPKLNCRNWECGVLVPVDDVSGDSVCNDLTAFQGTVPVPMQYPGEEYGDRKPWYYNEQ